MHRITFVATSRIPASAEAVFDWHEAPGAFERLTPPGERVEVVHHEGGIRDGARVLLRVGPKPFSLRWDLEHRDYQHGRSFTDLQLAGPHEWSAPPRLFVRTAKKKNDAQPSRRDALYGVLRTGGLKMSARDAARLLGLSLRRIRIGNEPARRRHAPCSCCIGYRGTGSD